MERDKNHEIRTYITRILSMSDLLLMTEVSKEQREYIAVIKSSTQALFRVLSEKGEARTEGEGGMNLEKKNLDC